MTKYCPKCQKSLSITLFSPNAGRKDKLSTYCTLCKKQYQRERHEATWDERKKKHYQYQVKRRKKISDWFQKYKEGLECPCGENNPVCLDFHHPDDNKDKNVSDMVYKGYSKERILFEIKKCIVVCKNCHAKIHYRE